MDLSEINSFLTQDFSIIPQVLKYLHSLNPNPKIYSEYLYSFEP